MTADEARQLLTFTFLDRQDVRDGFKLGTYRGLLTRAHAILGMEVEPTTEQAAKKVLLQAYNVAMAKGVYNDPLVPGLAIRDLLMRVATGRTAR